MLGAVFRSTAAAGALLFGLLADCTAQTGAAVGKPEVKPGDRWTYRRMDYSTNPPAGAQIGMREVRVTLANEKVIHVVVRAAAREFDEIFTSDWNAVSVSGEQYYPDHGLLKFPLLPGASYKVAFENQFGRARDRRARHVRTAKVVGWEEITVPAGKFRALKVELQGSFQRLDTSVAGTARNVIWYAPKVKRWVKFVYQDATSAGPYNNFGEELVSFAVQ